MRKNHEKLFTNIEPPEDLLEKVLNQIQKEAKILELKRRVFIFSLSTLFSAIAFVPIFQMMQKEFAQSGFLQFFSLLFSDFEIITVNWQNFIFSLLETLPLTSLITFLFIILVFLESLKLLTKDLKIFLIQHNNI